MSESLGQHKDAVRFGHSNNSLFKHVRDTNHAIKRENSKMEISSNDHYQRLVAETALIKTSPNFNNTQITLAIDSISSSLNVKSKPGILRDLQI